MLDLLRNRQFRLFWIAGAFADVGMITYFTVHGWLALEVTDSPFWVGATAGVAGLSMTICAVLGGVLADRMDRRQLVIIGMTVRAGLGMAVAALVLSDNIQLWHVLFAAVVDGVVVSFQVPAAMTLTLDIVGRARLLSATAARFAAMMVVGIAAPLLAGAVVSRLDIGWAYVMIA